MIKLYIQAGKVFVWNVRDWLTLREEHRIVGELAGSLAYFPRQESLPGLPLALLPEEVTLLIEKEIAQVVQNISIMNEANESLRKEYNEYRQKLYADQIHIYKAERKRQVTGMIEQIIEGKRRKQLKLKYPKKMNTPDCNTKELEKQVTFDKDVIIQEEVAKMSSFDENSTIIQICTEHKCHMKSLEKPGAWFFPETESQRIGYEVYKSLWENGFFVTSGHKFGVDFLIYPGDPIKFHAHFLVVCLHRSTVLPIHELIALGRLGTSVRKTVILASISTERNIVYQSLTWNGASRYSV